MTEPLVCAIMLTRDRPQMAARAVRAFRAQTYDPARRQLLVYDTGNSAWFFDGSDAENELIVCAPEDVDKSIGYLRNKANTCTLADSVIIHWDDDDYSHPNRIAEQVAFLQESGADVVGYSDLLFWRCPRGKDAEARPPVAAPRAPDSVQDPHQAAADPKGCDMASHASADLGEAWIYMAPPRGLTCPEASLCYWRKTWERRPFPTATAPAVPNKSEGVEWLAGLSLKMCPSLGPLTHPAYGSAYLREPRMIATLHRGNTCAKLPPDAGKASQKQWGRVPSWDDYCRRIFEEDSGIK